MKHKIIITDIYQYEIEIEANNKADAVIQAKEYYDTADDGVTGVANANSHIETRFKIIK